MALKRVTYAERQPISLDSLVDEQAYQIAMRRRHNLAHHDWGIVAGLELERSDGGFVLRRGMAVDGFGRELIVPEDILISADALVQLNGNAIAGWLVYAFHSTIAFQADNFPCGPGQQDRTYEQALLRLEVVQALDDIDGRNPPQVPITSFSFGPQDDPPEDSAPWPVFLGGLLRASKIAQYAVITRGRPYALLRGEVISASSGKAQVQVGAEASGDPNRFAVRLPNAPGSPLGERLIIDKENNSTWIGDTTLFGNLAVEPAPPASAPAGSDLCADLQTLQERFWGVVLNPILPPKIAAPWTISHALIPPAKNDIPQIPMQQLRFEFFDPGTKGDRTAYRLSIGVNNNGIFTPCLSVDAECNLTVHGNLRIGGSLVWGPAKADPADPRFRAQLIATWTQGLVDNTTGLARYYGASMALSFEPGNGRPGTPIACMLVIKNTGPFKLTAVNLTETLSASGATADPPLPAGFELTPGETKKIARKYTIPVKGVLEVSVDAEGVAQPSGYRVTANLKQAAATAHNPSSVAMTVTDLHDGNTGVQQNFTITITNNGTEAVQVTRVTIANNMATDPAEQLAEFTLNPGQPHLVSRTFTPDSGGTLTITATADITGPGGDVVHASHSQSVSIIETPN
jgi:hypothetical protein